MPPLPDTRKPAAQDGSSDAPPLCVCGAACTPAAVILRETAAKYGVTVLDLRSARRDRLSVSARHEVIWRMRHETILSLPVIGRLIGHRDHTTIMAALRAYARRMEGGR